MVIIAFSTLLWFLTSMLYLTGCVSGTRAVILGIVVQACLVITIGLVRHRLRTFGLT